MGLRDSTSPSRRVHKWRTLLGAVSALVILGAGVSPAAATPTEELSLVPTERLSNVPCEDGQAGPFTCSGIDLLGFVPLTEFEGAGVTLPVRVGGDGASDVWGWTDPDNGDEYVLIGKTNGTAFFRVTDPTDPVYLGDLPSVSALHLLWHDIKIYNDHAFIVSESQPHGMQVFDLTRLRGVTSPQTWTPDSHYPLNWAAHNVAINEETGFAYIVGGEEAIFAPDQCLGGLHMVDIREPLTPVFAGCYDGDGYIHDTQCDVYHGPDADHQGRELCFNSSTDSFSIVDVTDKSSPRRIARLTYPQTGYTHQGWLTPDQRYFLLGDEGDERQYGINTRTLVLDVTDLDIPALHFEKLHDTPAIDHNLYTHDRLVYESNYTAGLRVLDTQYLDDREMDEVAYFDTFPAHDRAVFEGTWSNYPYFESGTIAVSGIGEGLFLLRLRPEVFTALAEKDVDRS